MADTILLPILIPIIAGLIVLAVPDRLRWVKEAIALIAASANLLTTILLFNANMAYIASWAGFGIEFALRLYHFSAFIILAAAAFGFLVILYSMAFLSGKKYAKLFYAYLLITLGFIAGAVLSDHLVSMFFFWEGSLIMLSVLIAIGSKTAFKTAMKAFIILGISDLAMMIGIALFGHLSGTLMISGARIPATGLGGAAFLLLMIGAISKSGSMPFHSWIPDAAIDAPLPFMAVIPAAIEKLLGIYFLTTICLDMFTLEPHSSLSYLLMPIG
ncbi:MAG: proton-conducting transporter membrane subunit, partial [Candidatus Omnitrophica bacterium]|nr:proton-conducting transporter membrane subunit [Candidatus Omnitrophota bacterium]